MTDFGKNYANQSYQFTLYSVNEIDDTFEESFRVDLLEALIPRSPNLRIMKNLTTHQSAILEIELPKELATISDHLDFDGDVISEFDGKRQWKKINFSRLDIEGNKCFLIVDDLEYPNGNYNCRVRIKSKSSEISMWSKYSTVAFQTKSIAPNSVPDTCASCFSRVDNGNIFLYWKSLERSKQNGKNFSYLIVGGNGTARMSKQPLVLWQNMLNPSSTFKIYSRNNEGTSARYSTIDIPTLMPQKLRATTSSFKIRKELIDNEYKISWKIKKSNNIQNFTIFWCHSKNELPNNCDGSIDFEEVDPLTREFRMDANETRNYAVSVNYATATTGMIWAECTAAKSDGK